MSDSNANKMQVGGSHYQQLDGGEEHWDRCWRLKLDYFQSAITKYVERCWKKNGVQDLQKARHYLDKYIELHSPTPVFQPTHRHAEGGGYRYLRAVQMHHWDQQSQMHEWIPAVLYDNEKGEQFTRSLSDFSARMTAIVDDGSEPGPSYVNQDGPQRA